MPDKIDKIDPGVFTSILNNFLVPFENASSLVRPIANGVITSLILIEMLFMAIWLMLDKKDLPSIFQDFFTIGFWLWLCRDFTTVAKQVMNSLVEMGFHASHNGNARMSLLLNPSAVASMAFQKTEVLANQVLKMSNFDIPGKFMFCLALVGMYVAFYAIALNVIFAVLEFYAAIFFTTALIPLGINKHLRDIPLRLINSTVGAAIKLMVTAFVIAIAQPVLAQIKFSGQFITINEAFSMLGTVAVLMGIAWKIPRFATNFLGGSPNFGVSDVAAAATGAVGAAFGTAAHIAAMLPKKKDDDKDKDTGGGSEAEPSPAAGGQFGGASPAGSSAASPFGSGISDAPYQQPVLLPPGLKE